jgi:hypothetical protein
MATSDRDPRPYVEGSLRRDGFDYDRIERTDSAGRSRADTDRMLGLGAPSRPRSAGGLADRLMARNDNVPTSEAGLRYAGLSPYMRYPLGIPDGDWWRGRFVGRGPKGYRRSDARICEDVSDHLMVHPDIDASDIEVHVADGVVSLQGTVEDRHEKRIAEYVAESCLGVNDVDNQLKVRHGFWASLTGEKATDEERPRVAEREPVTGGMGTDRRRKLDVADGSDVAG